MKINLHKVITLVGSIVLAAVFTNVQASLEYESNDLQIVITPDSFPIIWKNAKKYGIDFETILLNQSAFSCYSETYNGSGIYEFDLNKCSQAAQNDGATHYKVTYVEGVGEMRVYFDGTLSGMNPINQGNVVGTQQTSEFLVVHQQFATAVDNNHYSQPEDKVVPGTIAGSFSVNPSGGATYSVDIVSPPGIAGMKPELNVSYSSTAGNGLMGVGWNLGGLSKITRCQKIIALESVPSAIAHNEKVFCLDGRKMLLNANSTTEYRTELESFNRITASDASARPATFTVQSKAGLTSTFTAMEHNGKAAEWLLTSIQDSYANRIDYVYTINHAIGEYLIDRINYAHVGADSNAYIDFIYDNRHVQDQKTSWIAGKTSSLTQRLKQVKTYAREQGGQFKLARDYRFKYTVDRDSGSSLLQGMKMCGADYDSAGVFIENHCYEETAFGWQHASSNIGSRINTGLCASGDTDCETAEENGYVYYPDINGDSKSDICYIHDVNGLQCHISNGAGGFSNPLIVGGCNGEVEVDPVLNFESTNDGKCYKGEQWFDYNAGTAYSYTFDGRNTLSFVDINADGKDDVVWRGMDGIQYRYSYGSSFSQRYNSSIYNWQYFHDENHTHDSVTSFDRYNIYLADLNGNGLPELCYRSPNGIKCHLNTGSVGGAQWSSVASFDSNVCADTHSVQGQIIHGSALWGTCNDEDNYGTIRFVDFNADGRQDLVYRGDSGMQIWYSNSTNFYLYMTNTGDQLDVYSGGISPYTNRRLCANSSHPIISAPYNVSPFQWSSCNQQHWRYLHYPDINGDGYADFCYVAEQGVHCFKNAGDQASLAGTSVTKLLPDVVLTNICDDANPNDGGCNDAQNYSTVRFVDLNGDGKSDITYKGDAGLQQWLSTGDGFIHNVATDICANGTTYHGDCDSYENYTSISYYADFNGDTKQDIVYRADSGINVWMDHGYKTNLVTAITNGMGEQITIQHARLSDSSVYSAADNSHTLNRKLFPERTLRSPMSVVKSYSKSDGNGGTLSTEYYYHNLKQHMQGRGLLGFAEVRSRTVDAKSTFNSTLYSQTFPYIGMPVESKTVVNFQGNMSDISLTSATGKLVKYGLNIYTEDVYQAGNNYLRHFPHVLTSIDRQWELAANVGAINTAANWLTEIETTTDYDAGGNVIDIDQRTRQQGLAGEYRTHTVNAYASGFDLLDGRLQTATVTQYEPDLTSQLKKSEFTYHANGMLASETIEPDQPTLRQTSTYLYDSYGNKTSSELTTYNALPRTTTTEFDASKRFPLVITNAKQHKEKRSYDVTTGKMLSQVGPYVTNGSSPIVEAVAVKTSYQYDGVGRETEKRIHDQASGGFADQISNISYELCSVVLVCDSPSAHYRVRKTVSGISAENIAYFDFLGREVLTSTTGFDDAERFVATEYDNFGRMWRKSRPYAVTASHWTSMQYDELDRVIETKVPALDGDGILNG